MRKKILLTSIAFLSVFIVSAQLEKGKLYGDLSIGQRVLRYNTWHVRPGVSLALNDKFSVGAFVDYTRYTRFETLNGSGFMNKYSIGMDFNYFHYFSKTSKWGLYLNSNLQYNHFKSYSSNAGITSLNYEVKGVELNLTPGVFFTTNKFLFYGNVGGYTLSKSIDNSKIYRSVDFGSQLNLGMKFNLRRKKR